MLAQEPYPTSPFPRLDALQPTERYRDMIAVYAGRGSSHSWTWFARMCSSLGVGDVRFVSETDVSAMDGRDVDLLVVSGGDGFEIASSIGVRGLERMRDFVAGGGSYAGMCAGAYLALPSSMEPFLHFNISRTRLKNISDRIDLLEQENPRVSVRYGSCAIFHPVRGEVSVARGSEMIEAPVFGGPVFREPEQDDVLLRYVGFTGSSSFQVDRPTAESLVIGSPAAVKTSYGKGTAFLFGPHLEHPGYPRANAVLADMLGLRPGKRRHAEPKGDVPQRLRRSLADLKVAVLGLENASFVVGSKLWDGGRLLELADAIEGWAPALGTDQFLEVAALVEGVSAGIRSSGPGPHLMADSAPYDLVEAARLCANSHFRPAHG